MKLSKIMLHGSTFGRKQCYGSYYQREGEEIRICALMCIYESLKGKSAEKFMDKLNAIEENYKFDKITSVEHMIFKTNKMRSKQMQFQNNCYKKINKYLYSMLPYELKRDKKICPVCYNFRADILKIIVHLNDFHTLSWIKIAKILQDNFNL